MSFTLKLPCSNKFLSVENLPFPAILICLLPFQISKSTAVVVKYGLKYFVEGFLSEESLIVFKTVSGNLTQSFLFVS